MVVKFILSIVCAVVTFFASAAAPPHFEPPVNFDVVAVRELPERVIAVVSNGVSRQIIEFDRNGTGAPVFERDVLYVNVDRQRDILGVTAETWWHVGLVGLDSKLAAMFLMDGGVTKVYPNRLPEPVSAYLLPIAGPKPRALEVAFIPGAVIARDLSSERILNEWILDPVRLAFPKASAEILPDGRIVLVMADQATTKVSVLRQDGQSEEFILAGPPRTDIDTASTVTGKVVVLAASAEAKSIEACIFDPDDPGTTNWVIGEDSVLLDRSVNSRLQIEAMGDSFVAAWISLLPQKGFYLAELDANLKPGTAIEQNVGENIRSFGIARRDDRTFRLWWFGSGSLRLKTGEVPLHRDITPCLLSILCDIDNEKSVSSALPKSNAFASDRPGLAVNQEGFPADFVFRLTGAERESLRSQL